MASTSLNYRSHLAHFIVYKLVFLYNRRIRIVQAISSFHSEDFLKSSPVASAIFVNQLFVVPTLELSVIYLSALPSW